MLKFRKNQTEKWLVKSPETVNCSVMKYHQ